MIKFGGKSIFLIVIVLVAAIIAFAVIYGGGPTDDEAKEKLELIRKLSKEAGFPESNSTEDVCLTPGCLDAALDILRSMNTSVDPCKDFYHYSCGRWISAHPIPPMTYSYNHFYRLLLEGNRFTKEILEEPEDPSDALPINQAKQFYKQCMDLEGIEKVGLRPLKEAIESLGGWELLNPGAWNKSGFDWLNVTAEGGRRVAEYAIVKAYVLPDMKNTSREIIYLDQPGFTIPRSILIAPETYSRIIEAFKIYIVDVIKELGSTKTDSELNSVAQSIIDFEIKLANISKGEEHRYGNPNRTYNPFSLKAYQEKTDSIDANYTINWRKYLDGITKSSKVVLVDEQPIIVKELEYVEKLIPILKEEGNGNIIENYVMWRFVDGALTGTNEAMRNISFKFSQVQSGAKEQNKRDHICVNKANSNFGMAIGVKYVERAFDNEGKSEMITMTENLREAFKEMVREGDWMKEETKEAAISKVDGIRWFMAYPDWLENKTKIEDLYKGVEIGTGYFESLAKINDFAKAYEVNWLLEKTDKEMWIFYPGVINAAYFGEANSITFPAGLLHPPFFGGDRPKHQNYGGIGSVIGHEITHGFDNKGSLFDKDGNLKNWWDPQTKEKYLERSKCISDQYGGYLVDGANMTINGLLTLGENIGDNGGIRESFKAYQKYIEKNGREEKLPGLESLTAEQLYFIGYANVWCENITKEGLITQILTDPHSPTQWRVNGPMRNFDEFAKAYNCPKDKNGMNPPVEDKCRVW